MTFLARTNNPEIDERIAAECALRRPNLRQGEGLLFVNHGCSSNGLVACHPIGVNKLTNCTPV